MPGRRMEKEKAEDMQLAREKLINKEWREKYSVECPELVQYRKDNISERQWGSINLMTILRTSRRPGRTSPCILTRT